MGATFGTAIFGTVMVGRMKTEIPERLPAGTQNAALAERFSGGDGLQSPLDPSPRPTPPHTPRPLSAKPAAAMHSVFLVGLLIVGLALRRASLSRSYRYAIRRSPTKMPATKYDGQTRT